MGRKGKHTGSTGLYPASVVRRIAVIKRMMAEGYTVEDIRGSFVTLRNRLEDVEQGLGDLVAELARKAREHPQPQAVRGWSWSGPSARRARRCERIEKVGGAVATVAAVGSRDRVATGAVARRPVAAASGAAGGAAWADGREGRA